MVDKKRVVSVNLSERYLKIIDYLIAYYPELGYKTVDDFADDAFVRLLRLKGLQMSSLNSWRKW